MLYTLLGLLFVVAIANGPKKASQQEVKHSDMVVCETSSSGDEVKFLACMKRLGHEEKPVQKSKNTFPEG